MARSPSRITLFHEDWAAFRSPPCPPTKQRAANICATWYPPRPTAGIKPGRELNVPAPADRDAAFWRVRANRSGRTVIQPAVTAGECLILTTGSRPWRDICVRARVRASGARAGGLIVRYQTSRNFYALVLEQGLLKLLRRFNGIYTVLASVAVPAAARKAALWELSCHGDRLIGRVNGRVLLAAVDAAIPAGGAGILGNGPVAAGPVTVLCTAAERERIAQLERRRHLRLAGIRRRLPSAELVAEIDVRGLACGRQIRFADLNGDGRAEILLAVPTTRDGAGAAIARITALDLDGRTLWQRGPWPADACHLTTDLPLQAAIRHGRMEIVAALGHELHILDSLTGKTRRRAPLPRLPKDPPFAELYNEAPSVGGRPLHANCLRLCNALGNGPHDDILIKDHHHHAWLLDGRTLRPAWHYRCNLGHFPYTADLDGDGRDEFFLGYARADCHGRPRWQLHLGDHADGTFAYRDEAGRLHILHAAGDVGLVDDIEGMGWREVALGHVQHLSLANFCPDLPGLERLAVTYWNGPGIIVLLDHANRIIRTTERVNAGAVCQPVNWTGDGRELIAFSPRRGDGGLWNEHFELVVPLPDTDRPGQCMEVYDILGLGVDQLIVWDDTRLHVYAPSLRPAGGRRYAPRRPAPNWSNYQVNFSLPAWR